MATPIVDPVSGRVTGATVPLIGFSFDESLGTIGIDHAFKRHIRTRVSLMRVVALAEPQ